MQTEVRQEMEFIVNVYISNKVVAVRLVIFEFQCSQRILGRVRIGRVFPVRIAETCGRIYILPVAACKLVRVFVRINRTGRVDSQCPANSGTCVGIAVFTVHEFGINVELQMIFKEGRSQVHGSSEASEVGCFHNTVIVRIT